MGRNGDGKTTLIRMLAKLEEADSGRVTHNGGLRLGVLTQHDSLDPQATIRHEVIGDLADHEWAGSAKIRDVLTGLFGGLALPGFEHGLDTVIAPLSGGERRRIALAKLLIAEQDLIVLDEPTNHLDVEGISWLAYHLRARRSALVCVTHDRWFLDQVCTRMWDVQRGTVHEYEGGYSDYVFARAERERIAATEESKRQNLMRKELAWLRRGAPARTSKPRYRIEAANELIADVPPPRDTSELMKFANARLGKTVFDLEDVTVQAGPKTLLTHLTWQLGPGDRIGLVGVNGAGKTSLLRALAEAARTQGDAQPAAGKVVVGKTVKLAYLSQEVHELNPNLRVLEAVQQVRDRVDLGKGREMTAGQLCEQFGFSKEKQWTPVGDLSGGERQPAPDPAPADGRAERPLPRRAHQRPRHRDPDPAGGPPRRLARIDDRDLPRPVLHRADHGPGDGAARRPLAADAAARDRRVPGAQAADGGGGHALRRTRAGFKETAPAATVSPQAARAAKKEPPEGRAAARQDVDTGDHAARADRGARHGLREGGEARRRTARTGRRTRRVGDALAGTGRGRLIATVRQV